MKRPEEVLDDTTWIVYLERIVGIVRHMTSDEEVVVRIGVEVDVIPSTHLIKCHFLSLLELHVLAHRAPPPRLAAKTEIDPGFVGNRLCGSVFTLEEIDRALAVADHSNSGAGRTSYGYPFTDPNR